MLTLNEARSYHATCKKYIRSGGTNDEKFLRVVQALLTSLISAPPFCDFCVADNCGRCESDLEGLVRRLVRCAPAVIKYLEYKFPQLKTGGYYAD